ncbi:hypothetical protein PR003_g3035 [Phytophthora rubi]|uniref:Uncharacterized protein n=1 Tax=Phytophthora rubi TaxID=129364 RepID=A0A6A4G720_9STRA|nr:hypothetical protein PR001_g11823 [Phytophthora rubi]KAE9355078.1 hypothetical protein PR003_g3035 [Phytophthora rubi]
MSSATDTSSSRLEPPRDAGGDQAAPSDHDQASDTPTHPPAGGSKPPTSSGGGDEQGAGADAAQNAPSVMGGRLTTPAKDAGASGASTSTTSSETTSAPSTTTTLILTPSTTLPSVSAAMISPPPIGAATKPTSGAPVTSTSDPAVAPLRSSRRQSYHRPRLPHWSYPFLLRSKMCDVESHWSRGTTGGRALCR